jgi:hypothetical protein
MNNVTGEFTNYVDHHKKYDAAAAAYVDAKGYNSDQSSQWKSHNNVKNHRSIHTVVIHYKVMRAWIHDRVALPHTVTIVRRS